MKTIFLYITLFLSALSASALTVDVTNLNYKNYTTPTVNSFSWAVAQVNAAGAGTHVIRIMIAGNFNEPEYAPYSIANSNVTIDGTQAPGWTCGAPSFFWNGPGYAPVAFSGNNIVIKGMSVTGIAFNVTGSGFKMFGCLIGLDNAGVASSGSTPGGSVMSLSGGSATIGYSSSACGRNVFASSGVTNTMIISGNGNTVNGNYFNTGTNGNSRINSTTGSVILVQGNNNTLDSNVILGSAGGGAFGGIQVNGASNTLNINHNYIGVNKTGTLSNGGAGYGNTGYGIYTSAGVTGSSFFTANVISNNRQSGISLEGTTTGLTINNNIVGLPGSGIQGAVIYGNGDSGIRAFSASAVITSLSIDNNTVCNSGFINSAGNASTNSGIIFNSAVVNSVTVTNNYTGVDRSFNLAGNQFPGIYFFSCGTMGGSNVANVLVQQNVVGDNGHYATTPSNGIATYSSNYYTIDNNYVGIGPGGQSLGNVSSGIEISSSTNFLIINNNIQNNKGQRTSAVAEACAGIILYQSSLGTIQNNIVSNNLNGGGSFVTNHGIVVQQGGQILIGGTGASQPNTINSNGTHGVFVFDGANNVQMTRNIISCNASMGISLNVAGDPNTIGAKGVGNTSMTSGPTLSTTGCPGAGVAGSGNASGTSPGSNATIEIFSTPPCKTCPNVLRGEASSYQQTVTAAGTSWSATGVTGNVSVTATNSTGSGGYFPTSRFSDCQVCSLPITLLYFNGQRNNFEVLLTWATAMELNNKEFMIERSEDGISFYTMGTVTGAINSSNVLRYEFTDKQPLPGISYYRLKQEDVDGTQSFSRIIAISERASSGISVFPNPAHSEVSVVLFGTELIGTGTVKLYNVLGQEIFTASVSSNTLQIGISIDVSSLSQGTYALKVITNTQEWVEQLIKR